MVGELDGFIGGAECHGNGNGAEDFFLHNCGSGLHIDKQGRRKIISFGWHIASRLQQGAALFLAFFDQLPNAVQLHQIYDGAHVHGFIER